MKRHIAIFMAAFAVSVLGAADFRIDISGINGTTLAPVSASNGVSLQQAGWLGRKKDQTLSCTVNVGKEWKEYSFSFMPKKSGKYNFSLMSSTPKFFVFCDNISVTGTALQNGNFETLNTKGEPANWYKLKNPAFSTTDGIDGSKCVSTAHNDRWTQRISCKKGEVVTVTFSARSAK